MVNFSTVLSLDRLPPMSFHKLSQHLYLNLHKILYSVGIVENTREYAKRSSVSYVLCHQRTQQFHKSTLNINCAATSTERALPNYSIMHLCKERENYPKALPVQSADRQNLQGRQFHAHPQPAE